jgi:hypothetical protein
MQTIASLMKLNALVAESANTCTARAFNTTTRVQELSFAALARNLERSSLPRPTTPAERRETMFASRHFPAHLSHVLTFSLKVQQVYQRE